LLRLGQDRSLIVGAGSLRPACRRCADGQDRPHDERTIPREMIRTHPGQGPARGGRRSVAAAHRILRRIRSEDEGDADGRDAAWQRFLIPSRGWEWSGRAEPGPQPLTDDTYVRDKHSGSTIVPSGTMIRPLSAAGPIPRHTLHPKGLHRVLGSLRAGHANLSESPSGGESRGHASAVGKLGDQLGDVSPDFGHTGSAGSPSLVPQSLTLPPQ